MSPESDPAARGALEARLRASVQGLVRREGARVAFLFDEAGMVSAAGGNPGALEPTTFVSLAFAQFAAARDLAPIATGGDLSHLVQEGGACRCILSAVGEERTLAVLFDEGAGGSGAPRRTGHVAPGSSRAPGPVMDLSEVEAAAHELGANPVGGTEAGRLGSGWSSAAEGEIDRIFRGEE